MLLLVASISLVAASSSPSGSSLQFARKFASTTQPPPFQYSPVRQGFACGQATQAPFLPETCPAGQAGHGPFVQILRRRLASVFGWGFLKGCRRNEKNVRFSGCDGTRVMSGLRIAGAALEPDD